jgi:hypothetical protein
VYGRPAARFGQGEVARVEMFVDSEKEGRVQRIFLEGNLDPRLLRDLPPPPCVPPPPPPEKK